MSIQSQAADVIWYLVSLSQVGVRYLNTLFADDVLVLRMGALGFVIHSERRGDVFIEPANEHQTSASMYSFLILTTSSRRCRNALSTMEKCLQHHWELSLPPAFCSKFSMAAEWSDTCYQYRLIFVSRSSLLNFLSMCPPQSLQVLNFSALYASKPARELLHLSRVDLRHLLHSYLDSGGTC